MTTYITTFDLPTLTRHAVGFDRMFNVFENMVTEKSTYPHHNIIKTGQETYLVELAVAGFTEEDISIELESGILNIRGSKEEVDDPDFQYMHRGIATRAFHKTIRLAWTLADLEGRGIPTLENVLRAYDLRGD